MAERLYQSNLVEPDATTNLDRILETSRNIGEDDQMVEMLLICSDMDWEVFQTYLQFVPEQFQNSLSQSWKIYKSLNTALAYRQDQTEVKELIDFPWQEVKNRLWSFEELSQINFHTQMNLNGVDAMKVLAIKKIERLVNINDFEALNILHIEDELKFYRQFFTALRLSNYVKAVGDAQVYAISQYKQFSELSTEKVQELLELSGIGARWPEMLKDGLRTRNAAWGKNNGHSDAIAMQESWMLDEDLANLNKETEFVISYMQSHGYKLVSYEVLMERWHRQMRAMFNISDESTMSVDMLLEKDEFTLVGSRLKGLRSRYEKKLRYAEREKVLEHFYRDNPDVYEKVNLQNNQSYIDWYLQHEKDEIGLKYVTDSDQTARFLAEVYGEMNRGLFADNGISRSTFIDPEGICIPHIENTNGLTNVNRRSAEMLRAYEAQILPIDKWVRNEFGDRSYGVYKENMRPDVVNQLYVEFLLREPDVFEEQLQAARAVKGV